MFQSFMKQVLFSGRPVILTGYTLVSIIVSDSDVVVNTIKRRRVFQFRGKAPVQHAKFLNAGSTFDFSLVYGDTDVQSCANSFYDVITCALNEYYPLRTVTITDCDPPFVTPEIKSLLRRKNQRMRAGKIEEANAISEK